MKHLASAVNVLAILSATLVSVPPAFGEQAEVRSVAQEPLQSAKHPQVSHSELKGADAGDVPSSARSPAHGHAAQRERLSPEECRQLRRDINDAGRDIYRLDRAERPRRF